MIGVNVFYGGYFRTLQDISEIERFNNRHKMQHKPIEEKSASTIVRGFIIANALFFSANILAVLANFFLNQFLIDVQYQQIVARAQRDMLILLTANVLPFPLVVATIIYKHLHLLRRAKARLLDEQALRIIANLPLTFSLTGAAGWMFGTIAFQAQIYFRGFSTDLYLILTSTLLTLCTAAITFVLSYYLLEYYQRTRVIPGVFRESEFNRIPQAMRPSLTQRFLIYILAASLIPGFITVRLLQILNNNGQNVFGRNLSIDFLILFTIITVSVVAITLLLVNSIRQPLQSMTLQASRIQADDFSVRTLVDTRDEIGDLSATMNAMTASLAEKEFIKDTFGRMVDPTVRDHLLQGNVNLGGTSGEAVVLFSDLAGFTNLSESRSPDEVVKILNEYFSAMGACVSDEKGIINKFIGDAILAVFGMPVPLENPADAALRCALAMHAAGEELNERLRARNLPELHTRIGLHVGPVIAGNIGSESRMEYTVIGDTVNTASRLESACKKVGTRLLLSDAVKEKLNGEYALRSVGALRLKGKATAVRTWTV